MLGFSLVLTIFISGSGALTEKEIEKQLQAKRSSSIPEKEALSDYIPENLKGFSKVESRSAQDIDLEVWGAESGWLSFWEQAEIPFEVNFHDITIDLYRFKSKEEARDSIIQEMKITGEVDVETEEGLPIMLVAEEYDFDTANGADAYLGFHQDNLVILIHSMKEVTEGTVSSDLLLEEAKRAFKEMVKVANN